MIKGEKFILKSDFYDKDSQTAHKKGDTGHCVSIMGKDILVFFDGYDDEINANKLLKENTGEGVNIVSWLAVIPVDII